MAELKHTFTSGRMNKDLDERLVPNGEYIDALNVQVSSTEGSDVGALENLLGNKKLSTIGLTNAKTIGSIPYNLKNKLYWFVTSDTIDGIYEYDEKTNLVSPVLIDKKQTEQITLTKCVVESNVDGELVLSDLNKSDLATIIGDDLPTVVDQEVLIKNNIVFTLNNVNIDISIPKNTVLILNSNNAYEFKNIYYNNKKFGNIDISTNLTKEGTLNFSDKHLITGVNIIDDLLFWTDNLNQPRRINITKFKNFSNNDFENDTLVTFDQKNISTGEITKSIRAFTEDDISVAKKAPLNAPTLDLSNNLLTGNIEVDTSLNLSDAYIGKEYTITSTKDLAWYVGNYVVITTLEHDVIIDASVKSVVNKQQVTLVISTITDEPPNETLLYNIILKQRKPIYELNFVRFGYRWKYINGEYSAISPFSEPAFYPDEFNYDGKEAYNYGMINQLQKVILSNFDAGGDDIKEVDLLYKETRNQNIYVLKTIKKLDFEDTYEVTKEQIHSVIPNDQLLRQWDNVPRKAKAQEITANRVIYGNYIQNYDVYSKPELEVSLINRTDNYKRSIKSNRVYQIGVAYLDEYNRHTPVLSNDTGTYFLDRSLSISNSKFNIKLKNQPPAWATHFKYYIKDVSGEYYNLSADRFYQDLENGFTYVSFPSSDRNKVTDEHYLFLKKKHGSNDAVIDINNRYKIVDIFNDPPEFITNRLKIVSSLGDVIFTDNYAAGGGGNTITNKDQLNAENASPIVDYRKIQIKGSNGSGGVTLEESVEFKPGRFVKFTYGNRESDAYEILTARPHPEGSIEMEITFARPFDEDVDVIYQRVSPHNIGDTGTNLGVGIQILEKFSAAGDKEFDGRFFIKLKTNSVLTNNIAVESIGDKQYLAKEAININGVFRKEYDPGNRNDGSFNNVARYKKFAKTEPPVPLLVSNGGNINNPIIHGGLKYNIEFEQSTHRNTAQYDKIVKSIKVGDYIRFKNADGTDHHETVYEVGAKRVHYRWQSSWSGKTVFDNKRRIRTLALHLIDIQTAEPEYKPFDVKVLVKNEDTELVMEVLEELDEENILIKDPAIFETEPLEKKSELDIYYETEKAFDISEHGNDNKLEWYNVISFGNGVESNRIRDDFNGIFIDQGVRASTVLQEPFEEDHKFNSLIWSGIINSRSGTNQSNQFNMANPITKDLLPSYGSVQKLFARDSDLVIYCEDKIVRALADKDILYNADGTANVTASNKVIGNVIPFAGEYGISDNPESFAFHDFRAYNVDRKRGAILRLSRDGITAISLNNMATFFRDRLFDDYSFLLGSYDDRNGLYNISFPGLDTVCFAENVNGWVTRKSWVPEFGISLNNRFYTYNLGELWQHDVTDSLRNNFYNNQYASTVIFDINDQPSFIKKYKTLGYEGTSGWTATIETDQQKSSNLTFKAKENKYFVNITGEQKTLANIDTKNFSAQGIGISARTTGEPDYIDTIGDITNTTATFELSILNAQASAKEKVIVQKPGELISQVIWIIRPDNGYQIDVADFYSSDGIDFVVDPNDSNNIKATLTTSILHPVSDTTFTYIIDGRSSKKPNTAEGNFDIILNESSTSSIKSGTFSRTGDFGEETIVNTRYIKADEGYFLDNTSFTVNNDLVTLRLVKNSDTEYKLTEVIYIPENTVKNLNYTVTVTPKVIVVADPLLLTKEIDTTSLNNEFNTRPLVVKGEKNAEFNVVYENSTSEIFNIDYKLDSTGKQSILLEFPAGNTAETYTITISVKDNTQFDTNFGTNVITIQRPVLSRKSAIFVANFSTSVSSSFKIEDYINNTNSKSFSIELTLPAGSYSIGKQPTNADINFGDNLNNTEIDLSEITFDAVNTNVLTLTGTMTVDNFTEDETYILDISSLVGVNVTTTFDFSNIASDTVATSNYTFVPSPTTYTVTGGAGLEILPSVDEYFFTLTASSNYVFKENLDADDFELLNSSNTSVISDFALNDTLLFRKNNDKVEIGFKTKTFTQPTTSQTFTIRPKPSVVLVEAKNTTIAYDYILNLSSRLTWHEASFIKQPLHGNQLKIGNIDSSVNTLYQYVIPKSALDVYEQSKDPTKYALFDDSISNSVVLETTSSSQISLATAGTYTDNNGDSITITDTYEKDANGNLIINIIIDLPDATHTFGSANFLVYFTNTKKVDEDDNIVEGYHLVSLKFGDCSYLDGSSNDNVSEWTSVDPNDGIFPKYYSDTEVISTGSRIYVRENEDVLIPGRPLTEQDLYNY